MINEGDLNGHVLFRTFGRRTHDEDGNRLIKSPVEEVNKILNGDSIDSISLRLMLQEHYETYYKIYDHDGQYVPPLTFVTLQDKERYEPFSRRRRLLKNFVFYGIKELYGYNFSEFLDLPRARIEELMEEAAHHKQRKDSREDALSRAAAAAANAGEAKR